MLPVPRQINLIGISPGVPLRIGGFCLLVTEVEGADDCSFASRAPRIKEGIVRFVKSRIPHSFYTKFIKNARNGMSMMTTSLQSPRTLGYSAKMAALTLFETLAVVSILSVLIALLIPGLKGMREKAQAANCVSNMRQLGSVLHAYRFDHNGWFYKDEQVPYTKFGGVDFNQTLVPKYLPQLLVCPSLRLTEEGREKYKNEKQRLQSLGGGYSINGILLRWKVERMPWPGWDTRYPYSESRTPFILENGYFSTSWVIGHQSQALNGIPSSSINGRSHGYGDALNFMFLDSHVERIRRNDQRDVPSASKSWLYPTNPGGPFHVWGEGGRYISPSYMP